MARRYASVVGSALVALIALVVATAGLAPAGAAVTRARPRGVVSRSVAAGHTITVSGSIIDVRRGAARGYVTGVDHAPRVRGARVELLPSGARTRADASGVFSITTTSSRAQTLVVTAPGFGSWRMPGFQPETERAVRVHLQRRAVDWGAPVTNTLRALEMKARSTGLNKFAYVPVQFGTGCEGYASEAVPPDTIDVYVTAEGVTYNVDFEEYVEDVLAGEFSDQISNPWPAEALLTGAVVVKTFSWYFAMYGGTYSKGGTDPNGICFDITDTPNSNPSGQLWIDGAGTDLTQPYTQAYRDAVEQTFYDVATMDGHIFDWEYRATVPVQGNISHLSGDTTCGGSAPAEFAVTGDTQVGIMSQKGALACALQGKVGCQIFQIYTPRVAVSACPAGPPSIPVPVNVTVPAGTNVTLNGTGLLNATVEVGTTPAPVVSSTDTQLTFTVPQQSAAGQVVGTSARRTALRGASLRNASLVTLPIYVSNGGVTVTGGSITYTYTPPTPSCLPHISSSSPGAGPILGGTTVTITGSNLNCTQKVLFGKYGGIFYVATSMKKISNSKLTAVSPPHNVGSTWIIAIVQVADPTSPTGVADRFDNSHGNFDYLGAPAPMTISPASGPPGTHVRITGRNNFSHSYQIFFGPNEVSAYLNRGVHASEATVVAPAGGGAVSVYVQTPGGLGLAGTFNYPPAISSVSPQSGPLIGGTTITLTGVGFGGTKGVTVAGKPALSYTVVDDTHLRVVTPSYTGGTAHIVVTNAVGPSAAGTTDVYHYVNTFPVVAVSSRLGIEDLFVRDDANSTLYWNTRNTTTGAVGTWKSLGVLAGGQPHIITRGKYDGTQIDDILVRWIAGGEFAHLSLDLSTGIATPPMYFGGPVGNSDLAVTTSSTRYPIVDLYTVPSTGIPQTSSVNVITHGATAWTPIGTIGGFFGQPAVVSRAAYGGPNVDDIYIRGIYGALFHNIVNHTSGLSVGAWVYVGSGVTTIDPTVVTSTARYPLEDIYTGALNIGLEHSAVNITNTVMTPWAGLGLSLYGVPFVVPRASFGGANVDDVYVRSIYGAVFEEHLDHTSADAQSGWVYLFSGATLADPTVVTVASQLPYEDVFERALDGRVAMQAVNSSNATASAPTTLGPASMAYP